jgi:thiopeptide-type bacteriocin biosynthesis protein
LNRFPPGREWLYLKLYGGWSTLDQLLTSHLRPLVKEMVAKSLISCWFFVRYADPRGHLRIRFHGDPARLHHEVLPLVAAVFNPLVDSRVIWKLQFETYIREVERYGGPEGMLLSEGIFRADSDAVLELLSALDSTDDLDTRWRLALLGVDSLLSDCGLGLDQRLAVITLLRNGCYPESQVAETGRSEIIKTARRILGERFRTERSWFDAILAEHGVGESLWRASKDILRRRTWAIQDAIRSLQRLHSAGQLLTPISVLAASYVHMHVNRIMRSAAREHEFVLYDFLFRLNTGYAVRARRGSGVPSITQPTIEIKTNEFM